MGGPAKILLLGLVLFISKAKAQKIEAANDDVNVTEYGGNYIVTMNENNHDFDDGSIPNTLLFQIIDATKQPTVSFLGASFSHSISSDTIDGSTVYYFYAIQSFDYETQERVYRFNLDISDDPPPIISLTIINIDDEPPSLTSPQCEFEENTIFTKDNSTCSCTVSDPDGWLAQMTFEIHPNTGKEPEIFALEYRDEPEDDVHSSLVYVTVREMLNYQDVMFYLFDIEAKDGAGHATTPNKLVRAIINVIDLPDTPPIWTKYTTFEQFYEQEEQTFYVTAIDGDFGLNYPIGYSKLQEDDEEADYISIDGNGTIKVKKIDRDKNDITMYNFQIMAYEIPDAPIWNTTLDISFYIIDIDNNPPLVDWIIDADFKNVSFVDATDKSTSMSFLENFAGTLNLTIYIKDIDTGDNARFTVELEDLEENDVQYTAAFFIVPTAEYRSGEFQISVRNVTYLDYEVPEWDHISFNVLSKGVLDPNKQDRLLVKIDLIDYNDEIPKFEETEYEVYINETAKKGEFIIQIMATDRDAEDKILNHTLIGSKYTNRVLAIESDTGIIYVNDDNAFDYDTVNPVFVQVRATDKVGHTATVPLTINLLDVNNKAPTISPGEPINVDENQNSTTKLNASITASDVDTTALLVADIDWETSYVTKNSRRLDMTNATINQQVRFLDVSYRKLNEDDDDEYRRDIAIDLVVNTNNPDGTAPDYELFDSLFIYLVVTDLNTDPAFEDKKSTGAHILISINDINDNTPFFPEALLPESERENRTVQEAAPEGTSVGNIVAIDLDVGDTVTYDCKADDPKFDWVAVNTNTGAFTVTGLIDADTYKTYYFYYTCTASDNGFTHTSDPLTVGFYIIDTNNKIPVITLDPEVYVDEKSPPDTVVSEIGTQDDDRDIPFHTVECRFAGTIDDLCFNSFKIVNNVLLVNRGYQDLDRDLGQAVYSCSMQCQDNPYQLQNDQNPHTVTQAVTIILRDINDHTPEVLTTEFKTSEKQMGEEIIDTILATDIDEGLNAEIDFSITKVIKNGVDEISGLFDVLTDDDYFVDLTHKQANLIALEDLRGHYGTYTITIGVADRGTPPNSALYDITLEVEKFNFESPRFVFPSVDNQAFILFSAQQQNNPLILFKRGDSEYLDDFYVTDNSNSDICNKWDIYFSLNQEEPQDDTIFIIDKNSQCSGQLQINNRYNADSVLGQTYKLGITANVKDGEPQEGEAEYFAERNIVINFLDNNQKPVFAETKWPFDFFEENETQTKELEYKASYEVEDSDSLLIFYYLVTSDQVVADTFAVDEITGTISLKTKISYERNEYFEFQIVASNDTVPSSNNPRSYLDVTCNVIDINNNVPQWVRPSFSGAIMSGYIRNTPILTVEATDADKIDEGKLTYNINGTIHNNGGTGLSNLPADPFLITSTTGEIRLNFQVDNIMAGYFYFDVTVWDVEDPYGNGPHWNTTDVKIFIITSDNTVDFRFYNTIDEVQNKEQQMLDVVSRVLGYEAFKQNIDKVSQDGVESDVQSFASLYFINGSSTEAIKAQTILSLVSNIETFSQLVSLLKNETDLVLASFPSNAGAANNLEEVLKAWLIGVSVVLGALCLILLVIFILKTRELNNRITKLTEKKFGSQESGLNRLGISAPTTNKHAIEGSNPMFNSSSDEIKRDLRDFDEASVRSGDSDLIGIEDSPQFDYEPNKTNGVSQYI